MFLKEITRRVRLAISCANLDKIPTVFTFGDVFIYILVIAGIVKVFGVYRQVVVVVVVVVVVAASASVSRSAIKW